jgi:hypothetical protein
MTDILPNPNPEPTTTLDIADIVERDLKNEADLNDLNTLNLHRGIWRKELVVMKNRTEMALTSSKTRTFTLYTEYKTNKISYTEYVVALEKEKVKRCNISRFLLQIENKIQHVRALGLA